MICRILEHGDAIGAPLAVSLWTTLSALLLYSIIGLIRDWPNLACAHFHKYTCPYSIWEVFVRDITASGLNERECAVDTARPRSVTDYSRENTQQRDKQAYSSSRTNFTFIVRFEVFTAVNMKNVVFWDIKTQFVLHRRHVTYPLQSPAS
jgi:hypothetical protein